MHFAPKPLSLLAALALFALPIAGCGDDEETSTAAETTAATASSTEATVSSTQLSVEEPPDAGAEGDKDTSVADGGVEATMSPEAADPESAATAFLVSSDTDLVCGELIAPPAFSSTYGTVAGCREGRPPASLAKDVEVEDLTVAPDEKSATATLVPNGGVYDGVPVEFELSSDGTRWLIASVKADVPVGP